MESIKTKWLPSALRFMRALNLCSHARVIVHEREYRDNSMIGYSTLIPLHRVQSLRLTPLSVKQFSSLVCKLSHLAQPSWGEGPKKKNTERKAGATDVLLEDFFGV